MEFLVTLRLLWARRLLLAAGAVVAVAAAAAIAGSGAPPGVVGVASSRVLIDTPRSQLLQAAPKGAETLPMRALLVADLLAAESARTEIARDAGLAPDEVDVLPPASRVEPPVSTPLVEQAAAVAAVPQAPNVLSVYADGETPMLTIDAHAPDGERALALVEAATTAVRSLLEREPGEDGGYVLDVVTEPEGEEEATGSRRILMAPVAAIAVLLLWCGGIILASGLARWLRGRDAQPA